MRWLLNNAIFGVLVGTVVAIAYESQYNNAHKPVPSYPVVEARPQPVVASDPKLAEGIEEVNRQVAKLSQDARDNFVALSQQFKGTDAAIAAIPLAVTEPLGKQLVEQMAELRSLQKAAEKQTEKQPEPPKPAQPPLPLFTKPDPDPEPEPENKVNWESNERLPWSYSLAEAMGQSRQHSRPMFVAFATRGCALCEKYKEQIYASARFSPRLQKELVPVWMFVESGRPWEVQRFARPDERFVYPTCVVCDTTGAYAKFVPPHDADGNPLPDEFDAKLTSAIQQVKERKDVEYAQ